MEFDDIDVLIARSVAHLDLDCERGCSWCCHQLVVLTDHSDAERILEAARARMSAAEFEEFSRTVRAQAQAIAAMPHHEAESRRWPCPLLSGGECAVYDVRPVACRTVVSPDSGCCRAMHDATEFADLSDRHRALATEIADRAFRLQIFINDRRPIDGPVELRGALARLLDG